MCKKWKKCLSTLRKIDFLKIRFFSSPIYYISARYLYSTSWLFFFSKLHLKCLTLGKKRWSVKASYLQWTWHGGWCNHAGSDLFNPNRMCLAMAALDSSFSSSLHVLCPLLRQNYNLYFQHSCWRRSWTQIPVSGWLSSCLMQLFLMIIFAAGTRHFLAFSRMGLHPALVQLQTRSLV